MYVFHIKKTYVYIYVKFYNNSYMVARLHVHGICLKIATETKVNFTHTRSCILFIRLNKKKCCLFRVPFGSASCIFLSVTFRLMIDCK